MKSERADIIALISDSGLLRLRVTPNAKHEDMTIETNNEGAHRLHVRVTCVPENGKANKAVVKLLAKALGIPKSALTLSSGASARDKAFEVDTAFL